MTHSLTTKGLSGRFNQAMAMATVGFADWAGSLEEPVAVNTSQSLATRGRAGINISLAMATAGVLDNPSDSSGEAPLIVNIFPSAAAQGVSLLRPISMTVRDQETYVDLALLDLSIGYASVHSNGAQLFDVLPNTRRVSLLEGSLTDGLIDVVDAGLLIYKTSSDPQKTVYASTLDVGAAFKSVMVTAQVRRDTISALNDTNYPGLDLPSGFVPGTQPTLSEENEPFSGTVLGLEHGPRGRALYLWLQQATDGSRYVRLTSYIREDNAPSVNQQAVFNWSALSRFTVVWNEASSFVEVYSLVGTTTERLFRVPITDFPVMPDGYPRLSGAGDVVVVYGQEGSVASRSLWTNIAMTADVGHPIQGSVRMSDFTTQIQGPEFWKVDGAQDPRTLPIGPWFNSTMFASPDAAAESRVSVDHFRMTKESLGSTYALYRREPGFAGSIYDGFVVQASAQALGVTREDACTGMGITVFDGQTIFQLMLFEDEAGIRRVGLLREGGSDHASEDYFLVDLDWSTSGFRLVVDPREDVVRLFSTDDLVTPVLDMAFDRGLLPAAASKGWVGQIPFIAFGHITPTQTTGVFALYNLTYSHMLQGWAARDGSPGASAPSFVLATTGSPVVSTSNGVTSLACDPGELAKYSRGGDFSSLRGATLETRMRISGHRPRFRSGTYLLLDDGVRTFALTFVDSYSGKYAALSLRNGTGGFREVVGREGDGLLYSFPCDWEEFHTYRIERQYGRGVQVYLDDESSPRISFPERDLALLPTPQYSGVPTIAFGQFTTEGATSQWLYLNCYFSRGYEISTKKNKSDAILRNELYNTQAIVVVSATDG